MKNIISILQSPWAIEPSRLVEINAIYSARMGGAAIDLEAIEKRTGKPLNNVPQTYSITDGVAILPLEGVLAKRMNLLVQVSGGTSTQLADKALQTALADPDVHSIILAIDSPGGTVDGTVVLANAVYKARESGKPIVALASGTMCSAAYWIGSAAQAVFVSDGTTLVGSIGVVTSHTDVSGAEEKAGVKTTEIAAGKYKRIASGYAPLTKEGRQTLQDSIDYTYSLFVDDVAKNRGVTSQSVLQRMADGRVFIGQQAIDAGLVDGEIALDALVARLNTDRKTGKSSLAIKAPEPMTRRELDAAAKKYVAAHPGTDYVAAVKLVQAEA
ncbi:signal peptide peptidase SppA [Rhodoferax sp. U2-2l]|uniref:signal peptide peptidase SppA n=1 Tax=Rhodoferax sp. U2-2l TaxID=2884000 RepID=UPI001D0B1321|nr:signal peptide peptidase SppA [Rhodoferax sp. U2-2l]MCB8747704.1 signal peptide peptidase SppA [Rhodoferax sp. U2-2l]